MTPDLEPDLNTALNAALNAEGDRLARQLAQLLPVTLHDQTRVVLLGRSLVHNLLSALSATAEQISRHAGTPLHALLEPDDRGRVRLRIVSADGEITHDLPAEDVLGELLLRRGQLHPVLRDHLHRALSGDEHRATRELAAALRSRPVLDALGQLLRRLMNHR